MQHHRTSSSVPVAEAMWSGNSSSSCWSSRAVTAPPCSWTTASAKTVIPGGACAAEGRDQPPLLLCSTRDPLACLLEWATRTERLLLLTQGACGERCALGGLQQMEVDGCSRARCITYAEGESTAAARLQHRLRLR
jgi:hypothetical protein